MADPIPAGARPLKYDHAEQNLLLILVGFAFSVIATRTFLEVTGYPQIASGDFHIAHVLWGGLLLYLASLSLLIWRGRRIQWLCSLITGIGFGLFIDEIGKFITKSNDYFYPLAAPLIYAFFLLSVLVYLWIRKRRPDVGSIQVSQVLNILEQGLDPGLTAEEQARLKQQLHQLATQAKDPRTARLVTSALAILEEDEAKPRIPSSGKYDRWLDRLRGTEARWIGQSRFYILLIAGFLILAVRGLLVSIAVFILSLEVLKPANWQQIVSTPWMDATPIGAPRFILLITMFLTEALAGILLIVVSGLLLARRVRQGMILGYWVLLFSLTALHLPIFYFEQFEGLEITLLQFVLLLGIIRYRYYYPAEPSNSGG